MNPLLSPSYFASSRGVGASTASVNIFKHFPIGIGAIADYFDNGRRSSLAVTCATTFAQAVAHLPVVHVRGVDVFGTTWAIDLHSSDLAMAIGTTRGHRQHSTLGRALVYVESKDAAADTSDDVSLILLLLSAMCLGCAFAANTGYPPCGLPSPPP